MRNRAFQCRVGRRSKNAHAAPNNSNTMETVVEVGIPSNGTQRIIDYKTSQVSQSELELVNWEDLTL